MGDKLKADIGRIREAAAALQRIHADFDQASTVVDGYRGVIGSGLLANRLDDFADNWKGHRKRLQEDLKQMAEMSKTAADTYNGVDAELAKALTEKSD
jgi:hypothetical protein